MKLQQRYLTSMISAAQNKSVDYKRKEAKDDQTKKAEGEREIVLLKSKVRRKMLKIDSTFQI